MIRLLLFAVSNPCLKHAFPSEMPSNQRGGGKTQEGSLKFRLLCQNQRGDLVLEGWAHLSSIAEGTAEKIGWRVEGIQVRVAQAVSEQACVSDRGRQRKKAV